MNNITLEDSIGLLRKLENSLLAMQLSWTLEKEGTKLEWRWKCQPSPNSKKTTAEILDFLMDANIRLSVRLLFLYR